MRDILPALAGIGTFIAMLYSIIVDALRIGQVAYGIHSKERLGFRRYDF